MNPRVSITVAVYNGAQFLAATLDSLISQTFRDLEIIVVDDGSTDATPDILARYATTDTRIRVHTFTRNTGIPKARNQALRMAVGEYIAVADADDLSLPERIEKQVAYLDAHPEIAAVGAGIVTIDATGNASTSRHPPEDPTLAAWSLLHTNLFAHSAMMYKKSALDAVGLYCEATPIAADYDLLTRLSMRYSIAGMTDVLVQYRMWSGNITSQRRTEQLRVSAEIGQRLAEHYLQHPTSFQDAELLQRGPVTDMRLSTCRRWVSLTQSLRNSFVSARKLTPASRAAVDDDLIERIVSGARRGRRKSPAAALYLISAAWLLHPGIMFGRSLRSAKKRLRADSGQSA